MSEDDDTRGGEYLRWRPHPWHGLEPGPDAPQEVQAFIELTPFDLVKYEVDKFSGYLRVDRPQRTSAQPPVLYGFIPRTLCAERVAALTPQADESDGDPLDICVFSERPINHAEVLVTARVIGGIQMLDAGEADDKIVAVLAKDAIWGMASDISELPGLLVERLCHYFSVYKMVPGQATTVSLGEVYGAQHAHQVVAAALEDYASEFGREALPGTGR